MSDPDSELGGCGGKQEKLSMYLCVGCLKDVNAQIWQTLFSVQHAFAWPFLALGVSVCLEYFGLFNDLHPENNRRPGILLRNPCERGRQVIIDVAVTGIDSFDRKIDDEPDQPG